MVPGLSVPIFFIFARRLILPLVSHTPALAPLIIAHKPKPCIHEVLNLDTTPSWTYHFLPDGPIGTMTFSWRGPLIKPCYVLNCAKHWETPGY